VLGGSFEAAVSHLHQQPEHELLQEDRRLLDDAGEQICRHGGVRRVDHLADGFAGGQLVLRWIADRLDVPFRLAFALPGPGAELLVLREPAQDFHVYPVRALLQDLLAPGRDLRYPA